MPEWKKIFQIDELKEKMIGKSTKYLHHLIIIIAIESTNEVLDNVVEEYVKKFGKKDKKQGDQDEEDKDEDDEPEAKNEIEDESGLYYYSKEERLHKLFDPRTKLWSGQISKPTENQLSKLRQLSEEVKKEEQDFA